MKKLLIIAMLFLTSCSSLNFQYSSARDLTPSVVISKRVSYTQSNHWNIGLQRTSLVSCRRHGFHDLYGFDPTYNAWYCRPFNNYQHISNWNVYYYQYNNWNTWTSIPHWNNMGNVYHGYNWDWHSWNNTYYRWNRNYNLNYSRRSSIRNNGRRLYVQPTSTRTTPRRTTPTRTIRTTPTRTIRTTPTRRNTPNRVIRPTRRTNVNTPIRRSTTPRVIKRTPVKRSNSTTRRKRNNN